MNAVADPAHLRGVYPLKEAARLAHMPTQTASRWIRGNKFTYKGELRQTRGVPSLTERFSSGMAGRGAPVLDFEELLTLLLVRAFQSRGLGIQRIKKAAERAQELYGVQNPFVSKQFKSDGSKVFIDLDPSAHGKERELIDLLSDQRQFRDIVQPSLFEDVVFVGSRAGEWWPRGKDSDVVVAPDRQGGAPHISGTGVRTEVVSDMVNAEGGGQEGQAAAADWFGLTLGQVANAVRFEEWLRQTN